MIQQTIYINDIQDIVKLVQPKIKDLVVKINKLPIFTKSDIKNKDLIIDTGEVIYYKTNNIKQFSSQSERYDNMCEFIITNKDKDLDDKLSNFLKIKQPIYHNRKNNPNIEKMFILLCSIQKILYTIQYLNWMVVGKIKMENDIWGSKFGLEYLICNPIISNLSFIVHKQYAIREYYDIDEVLDKIYDIFNSIYNEFDIMSNLYIKCNNDLIDLVNESDELFDILKEFVY